jgi:hypothetical protein
MYLNIPDDFLRSSVGSHNNVPSEIVAMHASLHNNKDIRAIFLNNMVGCCFIIMINNIFAKLFYQARRQKGSFVLNTSTAESYFELAGTMIPFQRAISH